MLHVGRVETERTYFVFHRLARLRLVGEDDRFQEMLAFRIGELMEARDLAALDDQIDEEAEQDDQADIKDVRGDGANGGQPLRHGMVIEKALTASEAGVCHARIPGKGRPTQSREWNALSL